MSNQLGILAMYLAGKRLEELAYFRKLSVIGSKLGLDVVVFTPDDVDEAKGRIHALAYRPEQKVWTRKWTDFPPVIYDRCRYHGVANYRKLKRFRKAHGKLNYISRPLANKWRMHQLLEGDERIAPHLPETIPYTTPGALSAFLKKHTVVYLKPKNGTGGRGIVRLQRVPGDSTYLMQGRDPHRRILPVQRVTASHLPNKLAGWPLEQKYILQQGIPLELKDGRVHDFRMLVQKNGQGEWQVTGCAGRIGPRRSVTSNLHGGGSAIPMSTLLQRRFASAETVSRIKKTAYALGLDIVARAEKQFGVFCEAGIDLAVDNKGRVWVLEVNPKPSREVFRRIGETDTYRKAITRPLEFALWLNKQKTTVGGA